MCQKNYYTVTGYITAGSQSVSGSSSWHRFKPENDNVGQVVAKNNLHLCIKSTFNAITYPKTEMIFSLLFYIDF